MRPLLAILTAVVVLGTVKMFLTMSRRDQNATAPPVETVAAGTFSVDVLLTFEAVLDPFALDEKDSCSLQVDFRNHTIIRERSNIASGTLLASDVAGIVEGPNEFWCFATAAETDDQLTRALRIRVLRDDVPIAEQWIASDPGGPVTGPVTVTIPPGYSAEPPSPAEPHFHADPIPPAIGPTS